ncbi:hypothetical protein EXU57_12635 [Segetibacter sp. 3557_3]|uniref:energy transducer TonB n=1 Tax=Segetibacter sp. 3557_3 TaxID=2547429 RepID=UPI00105845A0|nr:energy transducer TonB [Segetibacter sp. 3557_3]TDH25547.1 hypothetical protein EXU57_12635 [Segetibacter sp. 3557_3]
MGLAKIFFFISALACANYGNAQVTDSAARSPDSSFAKVDKEARFPGGATGWQKYLEHNLRASLASKYIRVKRKEAGAQQTAVVQFLVNTDGSISNVKTVNVGAIHPKLAAEAERVIKAGPKWIPAEQNGKKVLYQAIQNIIFQVGR